MRRTATLVFAACVAAFTGNVASAGAADDSWYVAPQVFALWLDDARVADDDGGASLAVGRVLSPAWDLELGFFGSEHARPGDAELDIQGYSLLLKRVFYREGRVNPFLSVGVARVRSILQPGDDSTDPAALYGVGVLVDLGRLRDNGSILQLRGDLGARRSFSSGDAVVQDPVDYIASFGIQYAWGGTMPRRVVDTDGDGVNDDLDNCPGTPAGTPVDASGCPLDDDGDGVPNAADKCPGTPAGAKVDANGCEPDGDGDGVADSRDQCPNTPAGAKVDDKGCELDGDGDGVVDRLDKCPDTPRGDRVDAVGCTFKEELVLQGVIFETNSAELRPESIPVLQDAISTLKRYPELSIEVAGHTDSRGSDAYNLQLSARRADSVLEYLVDGGVTNTLTSRGYGERQPVASNATEDGRQQNRRVVLRVLD
ncbi:MAG TPA: OmpA family protein [Steroidobacteraceae bacterium]|nr:OmpA family protein [Steroidobacteraceae bacterium]